MYYPTFLKNGDQIGICAPSAGIGWEEKFDVSLGALRDAGYRIRETASVRGKRERSADAKTRAAELGSLFSNPDVRMVMAATGGDFLFEILPYIDWELIRENPKWMCGSSDPTSILFTMTTKYDIATIYGFNAGSFDEPADPYTKISLSYIAGNMARQDSSAMHAEVADFLPAYNGLDIKTVWKASRDTFTASGMCIGGCIDVLKDLIGTKYDDVRRFVRRYANEGQIWYFDNFSMHAENFYRTVLQMRYAGWFENTRAVLLGRVLFPASDTGMTYAEAMERAFPDIPYITEMDIGHTKPSFTLINGAMMTVHTEDGRGYIAFDSL